MQPGDGAWATSGSKSSLTGSYIEPFHSLPSIQIFSILPRRGDILQTVPAAPRGHGAVGNAATRIGQCPRTKRSQIFDQNTKLKTHRRRDNDESGRCRQPSTQSWAVQQIAEY
jgi:hypothetical protein